MKYVPINKLKKSISQRREENRTHERLGVGEGEKYDRGQIVRTKVQLLGGIFPGVYSADREPQSVTSYDRPKIAGRIQCCSIAYQCPHLITHNVNLHILTTPPKYAQINTS